MSYNPYAPPAAESAVRGEVPVRGQPQPWEVGEAIRTGWGMYTPSWAPLTLGYVVVTVIGSIPGQVMPTLTALGVVEPMSLPYYAVHLPLSLAGWLLGVFFMAGFTRAALHAVRTGSTSFGDFFAVGDRFVPFVLMTLLRTIAVFLGLLAFIVPGIILALGFANAQFFVIDQKLGPVESLKESWESTQGYKGKLFVLVLAEMGIFLLGLLACCLGVLVAMPLTMVIHAFVYTKMSGTAPSDVPPYGGGGYGGPPGGYGGYGPPGGYGGYGGPPGGGYGGPPGGGYGGPPGGGYGGPPGGGGYGPPGGGGYGGPPGGYGTPGS